jgi:hypothetical protein
VADSDMGQKIEGLDESMPRVGVGASMMIGSYMLVFRRHKGHPRIQVLLQDGVSNVGEAWHEPEELRRVLGPILGDI